MTHPWVCQPPNQISLCCSGPPTDKQPNLFKKKKTACFWVYPACWRPEKPDSQPPGNYGKNSFRCLCWCASVCA